MASCKMVVVVVDCGQLVLFLVYMVRVFCLEVAGWRFGLGARIPWRCGMAVYQ
jgi:hypothetical protein